MVEGAWVLVLLLLAWPCRVPVQAQRKEQLTRQLGRCGTV